MLSSASQETLHSIRSSSEEESLQLLVEVHAFFFKLLFGYAQLLLASQKLHCFDVNGKLIDKLEEMQALCARLEKRTTRNEGE